MASNACGCVAWFEGLCACRLAGRLARRDPALRTLVQVVGPIQTKIPRGYSTNEAVLRAVVGQMVSSKAASAIHSRLLARHGSAEDVFRWAASGPAPKGPGGGLTRIKRKTLRAWWRYCEEGRVDPSSHWKKLTREELRKTVSGLYGLGPWSADILGIFLMGRLDIWPIGDAGLKRARTVVFGRISDRRFFRVIDGYESLAAVYFWELLNRKLEGPFRARSRARTGR